MSRWKKLLRTAAVLLIVFGALSAALAVWDIVRALGMAAAETAAAYRVAGILLLLGGAADILCGLAGLRALRDGGQLTPSTALGVLALLLSCLLYTSRGGGPKRDRHVPAHPTGVPPHPGRQSLPGRHPGGRRGPRAAPGGANAVESV